MKCSNKRGCEWVGTVCTLEEHVATCGFTLVPCLKQCKDDSDAVKHYMRKDLEKHLRNDCRNRAHRCEYCGEKGTHATITEVHDETCDMKIVPCPIAGCDKNMQRQEIEEHVYTECPHTLIPCKYKGIGCDTELKRGDMAAHEQDDKPHLHMALETVTTLQAGLERLNMLENNPIFVLSDYKKKKESNTTFQFPSFYTHRNGYHMALMVANVHNTHVSVYINLLKGEYDDRLEWPCIGKATITLLNQLEDKNHLTVGLYLDALCVESKIHFGKELIKHSELTQSANTQYLKDDTLYFRLSVEVANLKPWLMN